MEQFLSISIGYENQKNPKKIEFLNNSWLILPDEFKDLEDNYGELLKKFARILSQGINNDSHMLPISPEEILDYAKKGLGIMMTDPEFQFPIGYAKLYPWEWERRSSRA